MVKIIMSNDVSSEESSEEPSEESLGAHLAERLIEGWVFNYRPISLALLRVLKSA